MTTAGPDPGPANEGRCVVTACGRRIAVRRLELAPAEHPISRVTLDVGRDQGGEPGAWAALTADEARDLARLLLLQATLAEHGTEPVGPAPEGAPFA
ncbi:hypothetical protein M2164_008316 [Streptomyces sp. SAI-208]|uniref:hypothetical protein n=1 Tax=unclassified Streptomyces TaxID=2593676 RepID=UPI00247727A7|nr:MULTISPECIES: hypothetical protein [unclassified Streptomyces]MDH6521611.1 hypothetical protein [Streptomyces sp. SAI-090]MDH6553903.1 hypothetical protein [Streptomyces sp. SAI-041]MDH6572981.1 hypothetical protein [Streptomyces sp. SAI-117]MDH6582057.1 hypothetical protein [Streptomyces sp. SAI-133]MDH6612681.1 hypothetical protein [Streptomyces sp. SAI-208]